MNDTLDKINKLIELAIANDHEGTPDRLEERRTAALAACRMISKYKIPVGDVIPEAREWQAPSQEFYQTMEDLFGRKPAESTADWTDGANSGGNGLSITDRELDDEDPIRRQIILAWRAIREARKKLEMEWQRVNIFRHGHDTGYRG